MGKDEGTIELWNVDVAASRKKMFMFEKMISTTVIKVSDRSL